MEDKVGLLLRSEVVLLPPSAMVMAMIGAVIWVMADLALGD